MTSSTGDLLAVLTAWGNTGGPEDIDGSGTVDFGDYLQILGDWGLCPTGCDNPLGVATKYQEEACMGIDWATLEACLSDAPSANDGNCICWFEHYQEVHCDGTCLCAPNCPGADPWGGH